MSEPSDTRDQTESDGPPLPAPQPATVPAPAAGVLLRRVSIVVLGLLLVALLVVVVVLPDLVAQRMTEREAAAPPAASPPPPAPAPEDARRLAREKREAGNKLGVVLRMQTELEADGVSVWGGPDYDAALDTLAAGDAELQAGRFAAALEHYERVAAQLEALRASMPERLAAALEAGAAALAQGDGPAARQAFTIALSVAPTHEPAALGMERARVVEEVAARMSAGTAREARGELDAARDSYASAVALDAHSATARAALDAVEGRIRERDFRAAMSAALGALETGDFAAARAALTRAEGIRPGTPEVADADRRLQLAAQQRRIDTHRQEARRLEGEERWREAAEHYAAVLVIDPTAAFARAGQARSHGRARLHTELDGYLGGLERLSAPGPRASAQRLLAAAGRPSAASEPDLAAKVEKLATALALAQTPMQVTLRSDNLTEVTVYRVGRLGRFEARELELPPGRYVAVGTRDGYRDVRVEFTLVAGREPAHVMVRCVEKI